MIEVTIYLFKLFARYLLATRWPSSRPMPSSCIHLIVPFPPCCHVAALLQSWYVQPAPSDPTFNAQLNFNSTESFLFSNFQVMLP